MTSLVRGSVLGQTEVPPSVGAVGQLVEELAALVASVPGAVAAAALAERWGARDCSIEEAVVKAITPLGSLWLGIPPDVPAIARLTTAYYPDADGDRPPPFLATRRSINDEFERVRQGLRARLGVERRVGVYRSLQGCGPYHWARWAADGVTLYLVQDDFDRGVSRDLSVWVLPLADLQREPPILPLIDELLVDGGDARDHGIASGPGWEDAAVA